MSIDSGTWRKIFICYTAPDFVDDNPLRQWDTWRRLRRISIFNIRIAYMKGIEVVSASIKHTLNFCLWIYFHLAVWIDDGKISLIGFVRFVLFIRGEIKESLTSALLYFIWFPAVQESIEFRIHLYVRMISSWKSVSTDPLKLTMLSILRSTRGLF